MNDTEYDGTRQYHGATSGPLFTRLRGLYRMIGGDLQSRLLSLVVNILVVVLSTGAGDLPVLIYEHYL